LEIQIESIWEVFKQVNQNKLWLPVPEECLIIKVILFKMAEPYKKTDFRNKKNI
jgi:hypothetical protein